MTTQPTIVSEDDALLHVPPHLAELADAMKTANAADPITVPDPTTGKPVRNLKLRLSAKQTKEIMSLPKEQRAAMAEQILRERAEVKFKREKVDASVRVSRLARKAKAKRAKRNKRRSR